MDSESEECEAILKWDALKSDVQETKGIWSRRKEMIRAQTDS